MMKRWFSLLLALCLLTGLLPMNAQAAGTMKRVDVVDDGVGVGHTVVGLDGTEWEFSYTVPENGATVLIFFGAGCGTSINFFKRLVRTEWYKNANINIVAVECDWRTPENLNHFVNTYVPGSEQYIDYSYATDGFLHTQYALRALGSGGVTWPMVLVVTQSGSEKMIRYGGMSIGYPDAVSAVLDGIFSEGGNDPGDDAVYTECVKETFSSSGADAPNLQYTNNSDGHSYEGNWADTVKSALAYEQGGYTRVEYYDEAVFAERYDENFVLQSRKEIAMELPIFGGIYICEDYNFLVFGQENPEMYSDVEVIRVVRYSKDWERQAAAILYGADTTVPFDKGSLRFARLGNTLYIRTSRGLLIGGNTAQASLMFSVAIDSMTVSEADGTYLGGSYLGHVSPSANQFVMVDGTTLLIADHGTTSPRAVALVKFNAPEEQFCGDTGDRVEVLPIGGDPYIEDYFVNPNTGVQLGGFDYSDSHYLIAGTTIDQTIGNAFGQQNVFLTATNKEDFSDAGTEVTYITNYPAGSDVEMGNPHLVKVSSNEFCLLWTENGQLHFCMLGQEGQQISNTFYTTVGSLSDCAPIVVGRKIIWYVTGSGTNTYSPAKFYQLDLDAMYPVQEPALPAPDNGSDNDSDNEIDSDIFRVSGSNRCETAFAVANMLKAELGVEKFRNIIVANGNDFADALAGSYLAGVKDALILLHRNGSMDANVEYIRNNLAFGGMIYILGGEAAVPETFTDTLSAELQGVVGSFGIHRLAGSNRFVTNAQILEEAGYTGGEILVCNSHNFADALSASATGKPILLVNNTTGRLNAFQEGLLQSATDVQFTIIGGTAAVSENLANTLAAYGQVSRVYGSNREATSVEVAKRYFSNPDQIVLAYSRNFPDGLCGGPLANAMGAPLILTNARVESVAAEYVRANGISEGIILGGTAALTDETARIVFGLASDVMIPAQ